MNQQLRNFAVGAVFTLALGACGPSPYSYGGGSRSPSSIGSALTTGGGGKSTNLSSSSGGASSGVGGYSSTSGGDGGGATGATGGGGGNRGAGIDPNDFYKWNSSSAFRVSGTGCSGFSGSTRYEITLYCQFDNGYSYVLLSAALDCEGRGGGFLLGQKVLYDGNGTPIGMGFACCSGSNNAYPPDTAAVFCSLRM